MTEEKILCNKCQHYENNFCKIFCCTTENLPLFCGFFLKKREKVRTIAVDFDGVIHEYHGWQGENVLNNPMPGAREYMQKLRDDGWVIIVYTCRSNISIVREYLIKHDIPFDFINENPYQPGGIGDKKIFAHIYLDDRGLRFENWRDAYEKIREILPDYKGGISAELGEK
ncbi:MAG: hypothetical protein ACTSRW_12315 [Candidatus Helarchaeota archaeon]